MDKKQIDHVIQPQAITACFRIWSNGHILGIVVYSGSKLPLELEARSPKREQAPALQITPYDSMAARSGTQTW